jgi:hypothetical protein
VANPLELAVEDADRVESAVCVIAEVSDIDGDAESLKVTLADEEPIIDEEAEAALDPLAVPEAVDVIPILANDVALALAVPVNVFEAERAGVCVSLGDAVSERVPEGDMVDESVAVLLLDPVAVATSLLVCVVEGVAEGVTVPVAVKVTV